MPTWTFPTSATLRVLEQEKLPRLMQNRVIFDLLPIDTLESTSLIWEQRDNYEGLQQARGMNGEPPSVKQVGAKRYLMHPGVYGEQEYVDEWQLTERAAAGSLLPGPIDVSDLVMKIQDHLLQRRLDRIEKIGWDLLVNGTFSVPGPNGSIAQKDTFSIQTYAAGVPWSTVATATPLANFRAVRLLGRGRSVTFDQSAVAYMNQVTLNNLLSNGNSADIYGRRMSGLSTPNDMADVQQLLLRDLLPTIQMYDEGYIDDTTHTFNTFIPDNKVVVIGRRPAGETVGNYFYTRNAQNPGAAPGPYTKVFNRGDDDVPAKIEVHDGHNGGPVLYYPSAIVVMSV